MTEATIDMLRAARAAEKEQTLFYRALSSLAEERAATADIEALNGLLADEQHHLSRLTVRLLELGSETPALEVGPPSCDYTEWRNVARSREREEIARYEQLLKQSLDAETATMIRGILAVERQHERNLGGKYTEA